MSLDAANGSADGVKVLAIQAMQAGATREEVMQAGATREEVMQAVRVTHLIYGVGSVYTASAALKDIL